MRRISIAARKATPTSNLQHETSRGVYTRSLSTNPACYATPVPHPTAPGPPPKPPVPDPAYEGERIDRKRKQAELLKLGQQLKAKPTKSTPALQKRFWKNVSVHETPDGYQILLDSRPVRTAMKKAFYIPLSKPHLAIAIAHEWDSLVTAHQALKNHYVPLTSLTARALDIEAADKEGNNQIRDNIVTMLMGYLTTDTLLCWAPEKDTHDPSNKTIEDIEATAPGVKAFSANRPIESLRSKQIQVAEPIIAYLAAHIWPSVELRPALQENSIVPMPQSDMTIEIVRGWVSGLPSWELAGLERAVLASKSLTVATRLLVEWSGEFGGGKGLLGEDERPKDRRFGIEDAAQACDQEVIWQTQMWGEVEDTHDVDKEDLRRQLGSVILLTWNNATVKSG